MASPRLSAESKARAELLAGVVISVLGTLPFLYWLLTGKGPWRRSGMSSGVILVFPSTSPTEVREANRRMLEGFGIRARRPRDDVQPD